MFRVWLKAEDLARAHAGLSNAFGAAVRAYFRGRWTRGELATRIDAAEAATWKEFLDEFAAGRIEREFPCRIGLERVARAVGVRFEAEAEREGVRPLESDPAVRDAAARHAFEHAFALRVATDANHCHAAACAAADFGEREDTETRGYSLLELHFSHGLSLEEIARLWQRPLATIRRIHEAARNDYAAHLREEVAQCFVTRPDAAALERECDFLLAALARPAPESTWAVPDEPFDTPTELPTELWRTDRARRPS